jgi:hypothetical protein
LRSQGFKIMEAQDKARAEAKSKKEELEAKKLSQAGRMVSKKDMMIKQHTEAGAKELMERQKGKERLAEEEKLRKEEEEKEKLRREKEEFGGFTQFELDVVVSYMDPSGDNEISMEELIFAFRSSRRAKAVEKTTIKGRAVLNRILAMIKVLKLELDDFFAIVDAAGNGKGDGEISTRELKVRRR